MKIEVGDRIHAKFFDSGFTDDDVEFHADVVKTPSIGPIVSFKVTKVIKSGGGKHTIKVGKVVELDPDLFARSGKEFLKRFKR